MEFHGVGRRSAAGGRRARTVWGARQRRVAHLRRRSRPTHATRRSIRSPQPTSTSWRSHGGSRPSSLGPRPEYKFESTPLMVNGVVYSTAGTRRAVVALDAATGELLWMHSEHEGARGEAAPRQLSGRGLAYWTDGKQERILYVTPGYRLVALDATTGDPFAASAETASSISKQDFDQQIDLGHGARRAARHAARRRRTWSSSAPRSTPARIPRSKTQRQGIRPRLRRADRQAAVDLPHDSTARRVRQRHVGEGLGVVHGQHRRVGADVRRRGAGLAYLPIELPTHDYLRRVSVRATTCSARASSRSICKTGQRKWHYQLVHHGIWDMDIPCAADPRRHHRQRPHGQGARAADQAGLSVRARTARPVSRSGRSRNGRSRKATRRASGIRRRSRSRPGRRPTTAKDSRSTT